MKRLINWLQQLFKKKQPYNLLPHRKVNLINNDNSWYRKTFERSRRVVKK